jgi:hypothetical protein
MQEIRTLSRCTAEMVNAGTLRCRVEGDKADTALVELLDVLSGAMSDRRAIAVLVDLTDCGSFDFSTLRDAVAKFAIGDWRPWALVVRDDSADAAFTMARQLATRSIVTGVFSRSDLAVRYLQAEVALWASERRWTVARGTQPAARPDQSERRQVDVRRLS